MSQTPEGLTELEYARHILEEVLGWPAKGNIEMMGDCIRSISKSRKISLVKAHSYMQRAIQLARKQGVTIDKWFFMEGVYTTIRPEPKNVLPLHEPIDWEAVQKEQATPEFKALEQQFRDLLEKLGKRTKFPSPGDRRIDKLEAK